MSPTAVTSPALFMPRLVLEDFDDEFIFKNAEEQFLNPETRNLVVEFDNSTARVAINLDQERIKDVLQAEVIGGHYGFSPRLLGVMCAQPLKDTPAPSVPDTPRSLMRDLWPQKEAEQTSRQSRASDLESSAETVEKPPEPHRPLEQYNIANEVWHYSSVDWGHKFLCVGYNSLFNTHTSQGATAAYVKQNHPEGKRLWTWLILGDDGTVISIHENLFPDRQGPLTSAQKSELEVIRYNTLNVFRQLSKANKVQSPILTLPFRIGAQALDNTPETNPASLLFYYLFDDWHTTYSLVARREHRYGEQLEELRINMFKKAELDNIDRLHHIGRQLSTLKRIYQSYTTIIESILVAQKPVHPAADVSVSSSQVLGAQKAVHQSVAMMSGGGELSLGVALASTAIVRFARLKDRINLYALSEIQECLDEKESLVFL
ncbi:MAG: hypothetical protein LQ347_006969, partial [Umbilicaria vellea]